MSNTNAAIVPTVTSGYSLDLTQVDANISLANGMTAGYGDNDGNNFNPQPAVGQYGTWPYQPVRVGLMRNSVSIAPTPSNPSGIYTLYFMYNPTMITVSWVTNPSQTPPLYLYAQDLSSATMAASATPSDNGAPVPALANQQTVQFNLFFDRTYDMMFGNNELTAGGPSSNEAAMNDRGVLKDVAALYNIMATFIGPAAVPVSAPVEVIFGQNHAGQLFGFTGYLTQFNIIYGIFRHDMIPSRCEIDLTLTATYVSNSVAPSGAGAGSNQVAASASPSSVTAMSPSFGGSVGLGGAIHP
jgi:Contractile injection system tube protein